MKGKEKEWERRDREISRKQESGRHIDKLKR